MTGITRIEALEIIKEAIKNFNDSRLEEKEKVSFQEDTILIGKDGVLDSLGLVTIIVDIEYILNEKWGISGALTSEKAMSRKHSPFRTIASLAEYICSLTVSEK